MLDALTEPFAQGIGQRALAELVILGAVCGPLGVWITLYRQSYAAESIAHGALPGLVLATLAGLPLALGAAGGLLVAALAIALLAARDHGGSDVAVAVVVTTLFGAGALLALAPETPAQLGTLLFGDPLSVSSGDLVASAALAALLLGGLAAAHRPLALACFEPGSATSLGAPPRRLELILLALLALTTLIAVAALGNLLVVALLIAPGAAAVRLAPRLGAAIALAALLAVAAGVGGLYLSHYLELAAGASIALVAVGVFAAGLLAGWPQRRRALAA
jgi:ABC-type Mn2+/Zn2+ transport system permease subunit